jgi:hypothetical protein
MTATTVDYASADLADVQTRSAELLSDLQELWTGERNAEFSESFAKLAQEAEACDVATTLIKVRSMKEQENAFLASIGAGPMAATLDTQSGVRDLGNVIAADEGIRAWIEAGAKGASPAMQIKEGIRASVFEYGTGGFPNAATGAWNTLLPLAQPIAPTPRQAMLFMRDLIPVQRTSFSQIPYVRELNPTSTEYGASTVAEGGQKPDQSSSLVGAVAPETVIAANFTLSKQVLRDAPAVVDYINNRLPYLIRIKEDQEFLSGSGTWPDVQGILSQTGLQTGNTTVVGAGVSNWAAGLAVAGIANIQNVDLSPTACVMNPIPAWKMFTNRAASGAGTFDAGMPFSMPMLSALTVWGLPVKVSRVYPASTVLVGDFANSAIIFDRELTNVQMYDQHSTYPAQNLVLVQAEESVALAVTRPDGFAQITLG